MFRFLTIDNFNLKGKVVGVRVDINSPIINGKVTLNERIIAHSKTIKKLSNLGAKVIVLAHQGRIGRDDCISLYEHSKLISSQIKRRVEFLEKLSIESIQSRIKILENSDVVLLENLRFFDDEENVKKKDNFIIGLNNILDYYVFDAFSVAHRDQVSITGVNKMPVLAGLVMEKELLGLNNIEETKSPHIFLLGGAKPDDLLDLLEVDLKKGTVDIALLSGVIGELALYIKGYYLGKKEQFLKEHECLKQVPRLKKLMKDYESKIYFPRDIAIVKDNKRVEISIENLNENKELLDSNLISDIGSKTIDRYSEVIRNAGSVYFKGPAGNFESNKFSQQGTKDLIDALSKSKAFTYMGGGHSVTAVTMYSSLSKFNYNSLAGGALVKFLCGKVLPGVKVLEDSFIYYDKVYEDFVVVGSNVLDISVNMPVHLNEVQLGDKIKVNEDFKTSIGGGGLNVSKCLTYLGAKVGYLGKISYENHMMIESVLRQNDVRLLSEKFTRKPCAKSIILDTPDSDRVIFTFRGQNSELKFSDFDYKSFKSNNFYFTSLTGESFLTQLQLAKAIKRENNNSLICYNPSINLIKTEKKFKNLVKYSDILILNYEEAVELTKSNGIQNCLKEIVKLGPKLAVITDGSNGSYCYDAKKIYFEKAIEHRGKVFTTGAGDSFSGTFFYFYSKGYGIKKSMRYATLNSSSVISKKGAQEGLLKYEDLIKS